MIVRPDQYVADVLPLDGFDRLAVFFGGVMLPICELGIDSGIAFAGEGNRVTS